MHKRRSWYAFFIAMGRAKSDKHEQLTAALHLSCRTARQYSATSCNVCTRIRQNVLQGKNQGAKTLTVAWERQPPLETPRKSSNDEGDKREMRVLEQRFTRDQRIPRITRRRGRRRNEELKE